MPIYYYQHYVKYVKNLIQSRAFRCLVQLRPGKFNLFNAAEISISHVHGQVLIGIPYDKVYIYVEWTFIPFMNYSYVAQWFFRIPVFGAAKLYKIGKSQTRLIKMLHCRRHLIRPNETNLHNSGRHHFRLFADLILLPPKLELWGAILNLRFKLVVAETWDASKGESHPLGSQLGHYN